MDCPLGCMFDVPLWPAELLELARLDELVAAAADFLANVEAGISS